MHGGYRFHSIRYFYLIVLQNRFLGHFLFVAHDDGRCHQAFNDHEMYFTGRINVVKCFQLP